MPNPQEEKAAALALFGRLNITPEHLVIADRPDVRFRHDHKQIGLEITMADPEEYRRVHALRHELGVTFPSGLHDEHGRRRTTTELREDISNPNVQWQPVDQALARWARCIRRAYENKLAKLRRPGFERFDEDWLLIAGTTGPDNSTPNLEFAPRFLALELSHAATDEPQFHKVYIHFDAFLFRYQEGQLSFNFQP